MYANRKELNMDPETRNLRFAFRYAVDRGRLLKYGLTGPVSPGVGLTRGEIKRKVKELEGQRENEERQEEEIEKSRILVRGN